LSAGSCSDGQTHSRIQPPSQPAHQGGAALGVKDHPREARAEQDGRLGRQGRACRWSDDAHAYGLPDPAPRVSRAAARVALSPPPPRRQSRDARNILYKKPFLINQSIQRLPSKRVDATCVGVLLPGSAWSCRARCPTCDSRLAGGGTWPGRAPPRARHKAPAPPRTTAESTFANQLSPLPARTWGLWHPPPGAQTAGQAGLRVRGGWRRGAGPRPLGVGAAARSEGRGVSD
jgi:hypothetical protein